MILTELKTNPETTQQRQKAHTGLQLQTQTISISATHSKSFEHGVTFNQGPNKHEDDLWERPTI